MNLSSVIIFVFAAIIVVGAVMLVIITNAAKGGKHINIEKYRVKYLQIENSLRRDNPASFHMTVINGDKLVDSALRDRSFKGQTMAERMKNANNKWSDRNGIWNAHKLRNKIAHESDVKLSYDDARKALACCKRALKDLGAI